MNKMFKNLKNTVVAATKSVATSVVKVVKATCAIIGNAVATASFYAASFLIETTGVLGAYFITYGLVWFGIYLAALVSSGLGLVLSLAYVVFVLCCTEPICDYLEAIERWNGLQMNLRLHRYYDPDAGKWKVKTRELVLN